MKVVRVLGLTLLLVALGVLGAENESSESTATSTIAPVATTTNVTAELPVTIGLPNEKIARRIIDERLSPPRSTEFSLWNKRLPALGEIHHRLNLSPAKVTEEFDDNNTEKAVPKKTRTVGPTSGTPDSSCCGDAKSLLPSPGNKKSSGSQLPDADESDVERGIGPDGPAPRYHGNRPNDDRYGSSGWKSSSYLGYGKDKNYYDQRNHYAYDRYGSAQRPSSSYAVDGDRYNSGQRPSSSTSSGDRYGTSPNGDRYNSNSNGDRYSSGSSNGDRFGLTSSAGSRPIGNYQAVSGGYGAYAGGPYGRPNRPGYGGGGLSGSLDESEGEYPFENDPPGGPGALPTANLQTQKAVALKALAGVALIGAAAALASNPVLLPISVISGRKRRRRSVEIESDNFALTALLQGYIQPKPKQVATESRQSRSSKQNNSSSESSPSGTTTTQELVISPQCVARLACHVHRDYLDELERSRAELAANGGLRAEESDADLSNEAAAAQLNGLEHWFNSLIHTNILIADYLSDELKSLIQSAIIIGSNKNATCDEFSCLHNAYESSNKTAT